MSRRAVIEEVDDEDFDDDTDLPLPLTGTQGPILQELNVSQSLTQRPVSSAPSSAPTASSTGTGETSASGETVTVDPVTGKKTVWVQDGSAFKMYVITLDDLV